MQCKIYSFQEFQNCNFLQKFLIHSYGLQSASHSTKKEVLYAVAADVTDELLKRFEESHSETGTEPTKKVNLISKKIFFLIIESSWSNSW